MQIIILYVIFYGFILFGFLATYIIYNYIPFEMKRRKIHQYEGHYDYSRPTFLVVAVEKILEIATDIDNYHLHELKNKVKEVDSSQYQLLIIYGGELKSFKMRLNLSNDMVKAKYKKIGSTKHVEYYVIEKGRYISS